MQDQARGIVDVNPGEPLSSETKSAAKATAIQGQETGQHATFSSHHQALTQQHQARTGFAHLLRLRLPKPREFCQKSFPRSRGLIDQPIPGIARILDGGGRDEGVSLAPRLANAFHQRAGRQYARLDEFLLAGLSPALRKDGRTHQVDYRISLVDRGKQITGLPSTHVYRGWKAIRLRRTHQGDDTLTTGEQGLHQVASDHAVGASDSDSMRPDGLLFIHQSSLLSG